MASFSILRISKPQTLALAVLALAALMSRLYPLYISPYPFNNDSITEYAIATNILETGYVEIYQDSDLITHSSSIPIFNIFLAYISSALGVSPLDCGQLIIAMLSVLIVLGMYALGRHVCGSFLGGVTTAFLGIVFGTFVYTTGSVWKEALALSFMVLVLIAFIGRSRPGTRALLFVLLMVLPITHHLVAVVTLLTLALAVLWGWYVALRNRALKRRHVLDALTVAVPGGWALAYYFLISFGALQELYSERLLALMPVFFLLLFVVVAAVLSRRSHWRMTLAPVVGAAVVILLLLDYSGYLFPYSPSAPVEWYLLLVGATALIVTFAWYGSEMIVERCLSHRTIQLCLLLAPIALIGAAFLSGMSYSSHKVTFRSFDFLDIPLFLGVGFGLMVLRKKSPRKYAVIGIAIAVVATATFPFGYESETLLGVRHDTQPFEVDALMWLSDVNLTTRIVSDERIAYVSSALIGVWRDNDMPEILITNQTLSPWVLYIVEDRWTTVGVNDFPRGLAVVPETNYSLTLKAANVFYIGGPADDRMLVFLASGIGQFYTYGPFVWPPEE
ncbi:MAG: hypothetical protein JW880_03755 [Candidatus Thermoplasmatota archaeon]|nr:hypothetical protein [Candidatus Thermoplasmatota archaeon]